MPKDAFPRYPRSPDHLPDGDPVGRDGMARLTGRSRGAVAKWIERFSLPLADGPWVDGPTWRYRTFVAWAFKEGFLGEAETAVYEEGRRWFDVVDPATLRSVRELRAAHETGWVVGYEGDTLA